LLFPEILAKPTMLEFDRRQGCSDGGAGLLKAIERHARQRLRQWLCRKHHVSWPGDPPLSGSLYRSAT
jgi:hypothetical protein